MERKFPRRDLQHSCHGFSLCSELTKYTKCHSMCTNLIAHWKLKCFVYGVVSCATLILILSKGTPLAYSFGTNASSVEYENITLEEISSKNAIHLVVIISGSRSYNQALTMIKSLFLAMGRWDRNSCSADRYISGLETATDVVDLVFHLILDDSTYQHLRPTLLDWKPRRVSVYFYKLQRYTGELKDLKNSHYGGSSTMVKLLITQIMPIEVEKVIILDADMLFLSAVQELWNYFNQFDEQQVFGMVQEQNPYYRLTMGRLYWPQLDRGYNAGLMLVHLARLRRLNWDVIWRECSKAVRTAWKRLPTGEQDIYNSVFHNNRQLIHDLPCNWNYQLSILASDKKCLVTWPSLQVAENLTASDAGANRLMNVKLAHFNAPLKPEDRYPKPWDFPDAVRNDIPLTRVQAAHRFLKMYYSLRKMSITCFR